MIGKGGETINRIIEECGQVKINVEEDGTVAIYHTDQEMIDRARGMVEDITREAQVGDVFDATVSEVRESFAFVTLFTGTDALLHVSELAWERTPNIAEVLHPGDQIRVKVINKDESGKLKVSAKDLLPKPEGYVEPKKTLRPQKDAGGRHGFRGHEHNGKVERRVFKKNAE